MENMETQKSSMRQGIILGVIVILVIGAIVWAMVVKNNKKGDAMMENNPNTQTQDNSMMDDHPDTQNDAMMDDSDAMMQK